MKTLCDVAQEAEDNIAQKKFLCSVVLILLGQHFTGKNIFNVVQEATDKIAQKKTLVLILLGQYSTEKNPI